MINQLEIFKSLFKGRDDVFAKRWDKEGSAGYMPVYDLDWDDYAKHKAKGGALNNFPDKRFFTIKIKRWNCINYFFECKTRPEQIEILETNPIKL